MKTLRLAAFSILAVSLTSSCTSLSGTSPKSGTREVATYRGHVKSQVRTTAYSHEEAEAAPYGRKNAIGTTLKYGQVRSAAADWSVYPVGTVFKIAGQPYLYEVDDYGSALVGTQTIDLYKPSISSMNSWGVRHVDIEIVRWGSYEKSLSIIEPRESKGAYLRRMANSIRNKI